MTPPTSTQAIARFGPYELDVRSGEVRKFGVRVKLGEQPLRILILLMERPGELVTREELRARLWSHDTFVDFDHSLNSAVQRLRETLSDTADRARWIETVPRRGYRFVGSVEWSKPNGSAPVTVSAIPITNEPAEHPLPEPPASPIRPSQFLGWRLLAAVLVLFLAAAIIKIVHGERILPSAAPIRSIAVLPLENLSGDPSQEYFADGMTDELITALAKNHSLRIVSRTSAMQFKGVRRPVRDIARELGVDGILEASVTRSASRVHLTVQLIDARTDTHIWAESYDRDLSAVFSLPSELSQTVAKEVKIAVSSPVQQPHINPEAYDAYLHGRYYWFSDNNSPSLEYFEKAIQLQPDYAAAWSGLSDYYGASAVGGELDPQKARSQWEAAAHKAVELDDSLPEAHNSLAALYFFGDWDCAHADAESQRAIALDPNYAEAHHLRSYIFTAMNRPEEAVREQKLGIEADPFQRPWALGFTYYRLRQFDAAVTELRLRADASPRDGGTHFILSEAYWSKGMFKEAVQELEQKFLVDGDRTAADALTHAFHNGGSAAVAEWRWQNTKRGAHHGYASPWWMAMDCARARHKEETLKLLEAAYREHSPRLIFLQNEPLFDFLHSDTRYQSLAKKLPLSPAF
jgi:TolB-like protein/DNA-binding winged helix-turn-helix (wHTH) protein